MDPTVCPSRDIVEFLGDISLASVRAKVVPQSHFLSEV